MPLTMLSATSVVWRGLTIAGPSIGGDFQLRDVTGWETLPQVSFDSVRAAGGVGAVVTPGEMDARIVTLSGWCMNAAARNTLLASFWSNAKPSVGSRETETLTVTHGGLTLSVDAQLQKADANPEAGWAVGRFGFVLQWRCPDPLRYGAQVLYSTDISNSTSGISFPVTPPWAFPAAPLSGQLVVSNPGTANAPAVFSLNGPLNAIGLDVAGSRVTYGFNLNVGDSLVIDTAQGAAFFNGSFRSPAAGSVRTQQLMVPPGISTVQAIGSAGGGGTPWVTASFRPAYW